MTDLIFISIFALVLANLLGWGFKHLPGERWQILAVVPIKKKENGWLGTNLTYYGFFVATSQILAISLLLILLKTINVSIYSALIPITWIMVCCLIAAKLVAILVEKKRHTFTIGGASFVGIILAPWTIVCVNEFFESFSLGFEQLPVVPLISAISICYTLGEGFGRLGCISYGCCYGKPVEQCNKFLQSCFSNLSFIFYGETKKVSYEGKLAGKRLVPIQAITCILYTIGALIGCYLFLQGFFTAALLLTITLTQVWRIFSELFRADFRGFGRISAYQKMGILSVIYTAVLVTFLHAPPYIDPMIQDGLSVLWEPGIIVSLQLAWFLLFSIFGRSSVTRANVSFELIQERI